MSSRRGELDDNLTINSKLENMYKGKHLRDKYYDAEGNVHIISYTTPDLDEEDLLDSPEIMMNDKIRDIGKLLEKRKSKKRRKFIEEFLTSGIESSPNPKSKIFLLYFKV